MRWTSIARHDGKIIVIPFFFERKIETFLNFFGLITYYKLHTSQKRII